MQVGWLVSAVLQTDKLYDLLGSTTFVALAVGTLAFAARLHARSIVATVLVCCWALRLGGFLFFRVLKTGSDSRFDKAKKEPGSATLVKHIVASHIRAAMPSTGRQASRLACLA